MYFGSDNQTGASEPVLRALVEANTGICASYGDDQWTAAAVKAVQAAFECDCEVFFVASGTAANCLALSSMLQPWEVIVCHSQAHILVDESTAPEFFTGGARLLAIGEGEAKITPGSLSTRLAMQSQYVPHNPLLGVLSLTQANEAGQVYTPEEVRTLAAMAHQQGMRVHMDGARFANALAGLGCSAAELTWKAGVDVLCLGASKNGCLSAEMVIFFDKRLAQGFVHRRKRSGHLLSKGRLFGAQVVAWFKDQHWLTLATQANLQAQLLADALQNTPGVSLVWRVEANEIFALIPAPLATELEAAGAVFYDWGLSALPAGQQCETNQRFVRLVTSFATTDEDVQRFSQLLPRR